jgi:hypothetical protein
MENKIASTFASLDLGSAKPTSVPMDTVEVLVEGDLFDSYATSFVKEAFRKNPLRAEQIALTSEEVNAYSRYLLTKRIESISGNCADFRKLKALYIPAWIQYNLSMIGTVTIRDRGIKLVPVEENPSQMTYDEALKVSEKIGMFIDDLQIVQDAMPRTEDGDLDVMSTALIAGYMRSLNPVKHVASTYAAAFMGLKLKEEMAFSALYRVQYDDIQYIASALTTQRGLF